MIPPRPWLLALLVASLTFGCESPRNDASSSTESSSQTPSSSSNDDSSKTQRKKADNEGDPLKQQRLAMVREQIAGRDVDDKDVLEAMRAVPRHEFVPNRFRSRAYDDTPLPIGHEQTISQPYIVAAMSEALKVDSSHKVLEIGTGSGYQAAILSQLAGEVYSIEIICELANRARKTLDRAGHDNVTVKCGDGYEGWPKHAPFERIIVTAAPPEIPQALVDQLAKGGRMVLPVGDQIQELKIVEKKQDGSTEVVDLMGVRFVPMVHGESDAN